VRQVEPAAQTNEPTNPNDTTGFAQRPPTPPTRPIDQTWLIAPGLALVLKVPDQASAPMARKAGKEQHDYL